MPGPAAGLIAAALAAAEVWARRPGASVSGSADRQRVVAIGWATVELDRATAELSRDLGLLAGAFLPAGPSGALGAECRVAAGVLPGERSLAVLEPATEGPLAAALARWGEGPRAVWLAPSPAPGDPADEVVDRVGSAGPTRAEPFPSGPARPGPFGPERRLPGGWLDDPVRLLLVALPGTIRP